MKDYRMLALIAEEVGMINRIQKMYGDALANFQESLAINKQLKDSLRIISASLNIARVYLFESKWDSCSLYYLKSASNLNGNLNCSKELEHYAS
ncbi:tetratricopeptide repeat protein [Bacteroides thetaiotaomicron]|nr:tetratricopeptide repeat protein [Bacteroides thetaiotaomicron]